MAELKTKENDASVTKFLENVSDEQKKKDSFVLLKLFTHATKQKPKMWGSSIIGFGKYHYKSERSSQEGDWPLLGFSPRKQALTLYMMSGFKGHEDVLKKIGKYKLSSGSCMYVNKLGDINLPVLNKLISQSYKQTQKKYNNKK